MYLKKIKASTISLALLSIVLASSCSNNKNNNTPASSNATSNTSSASRIAYINLDTLQEKYTFWKKQTEELANEQSRLETEIQNEAQKLQKDYMAFQQKVQSGTVTEAEGKATQQRLGQAQQNLETKRANLSEAFQKKQIEFTEALQKNIDAYLEQYNKDNKYDYILSYTKSGQILYANKSLDITNDVLKGLNDFTPITSTDSTKK